MVSATGIYPKNEQQIQCYMLVPSAVMDNNLKCLGGRGQRKTELFIFNVRPI